MRIIGSGIILSIATVAFLFPAASSHAVIYSKSKALAVVEAGELPEQAHIAGEALLLHWDGAGNTYLYVEQEQGRRLAVFDVSDPARIRLTVSMRVGDQGPFDFVGSCGDDAALLFFRETKQSGLLDLRQAKKPHLRALPAPMDLLAAEELGNGVFLAFPAGYSPLPAVAGDVQVIDFSAATPTLVTTVRDVKYRVTNHETGTTFLLGSEGLTVLRRLPVEYQHQTDDLHMQGN